MKLFTTVGKSVCVGVITSMLLFGCEKEDGAISEQQSQLTSQLKTEVVSSSMLSSNGLKDVASFPIGNVWSGGHPTWGSSRGTDLGGPGDSFEWNAFGTLSTVNLKDLDIAKEHEILNQEFNSITPEMALKMHNISINPDSIDFSEADAMMEFAEANGFRVHGHVLLFDKSVPQWALDYKENNTWTEEQWSTWLENYVDQVVGRYSGRIASWDVLNEIATNTGIKDKYFWNEVAGADVVERVFKQVEALDPNALLFVNDNFQEFSAAKNNAVLDFADDLKQKGCKVDGIGYQNHIVLAVTQGSYQLNKNAYTEAVNRGYMVHVSELDVSVNLLGTTLWNTWYQQETQRAAYNNIARAYRDAVPQDKRFGITIWNISDKNSYLNLLQVFEMIKVLGPAADDYPLLWDKNYNVKSSYVGFFDGLMGNSFRTSDENDQAIQSHDMEKLEKYIDAHKKLMIEELGFSEEDFENSKKHTLSNIADFGTTAKAINEFTY